MVYLAGVSAVIHYLWLVKSDLSEPLFYAGVVFVLLASRLHHHFKQKRFSLSTDIITNSKRVLPSLHKKLG
ncbi:hypothetical protein [Methyloprofundus sp.]|uniref:hypothetical protein n=1 Tax=Methyloprofundus sp. TaxID=2020875 RepID=UPI003D0BA0AC